MRTWIAALAALAVMAGAAVAHNHSDLQRELDQVKAQLQAVQGRLAEMESAETGVAGLGSAMRGDLEALGGKVGIFDVGISAMVVAQHGIDVQKSSGPSDGWARAYVNFLAVEAGVPMDNAWVNDRTRTDLSMNLEFEMAAELMPGATAYMRVESDQGDGVLRQTGTFAGVNHGAQDKSGALTLSELWYRQSIEDDMLMLTVGKIDLSRMFDANAVAGDPNTQFLSNALVDNMTIDYPAGNPSESPGVAPGVVARLNGEGVAPLNSWYVMGALADGEQSNMWSRMNKEYFAILEAGVQVEFEGLEGNYRIYAWRNERDHLHIRRPPRTLHASGWGVSFDQQVMDPLALFFRWGMRDKDPFVLNRAYSLGAVLDGDMWGRADDAVGLAGHVAKWGGPARRIVRGDYEIRTGDELLAEAFYRCQVNDFVAVSPIVQWVKNPGGWADRHDLWVLGVRATVDF